MVDLDALDAYPTRAVLGTPRMLLRSFSDGDLDALATMVEDEEQCHRRPLWGTDAAAALPLLRTPT
jgi:hypothetical protein